MRAVVYRQSFEVAVEGVSDRRIEQLSAQRAPEISTGPYRAAPTAMPKPDVA